MIFFNKQIDDTVLDDGKKMESKYAFFTRGEIGSAMCVVYL
jgi:hypothetical protein